MRTCADRENSVCPDGDRKSSVWRYPKQSFANGRLATEISRFVLPERLFSIHKGKGS